jgi:hypothetical protein
LATWDRRPQRDGSIAHIRYAIVLAPDDLRRWRKEIDSLFKDDPGRPPLPLKTTAAVLTLPQEYAALVSEVSDGLQRPPTN